MAILDIELTAGDKRMVLEIPAAGLHAAVDIEVKAGAPNGSVEEISLGSLNAAKDSCTNKILIKQIKTPDSFAA